MRKLLIKRLFGYYWYRPLISFKGDNIITKLSFILSVIGINIYLWFTLMIPLLTGILGVVCFFILALALGTTTDKGYRPISRAPIVLSIGFIVCGIISIIAPGVIALIASLLWSVFTLYFSFPLKGFGYFQKHPILWKEMDDLQKWMFFKDVMNNNILQKTNHIDFTTERRQEWSELNIHFKDKYGIK